MLIGNSKFVKPHSIFSTVVHCFSKKTRINKKLLLIILESRLVWATFTLNVRRLFGVDAYSSKNGIQIQSRGTLEQKHLS